MDAAVEGGGDLRIDLRTEPRQAAERRLDVTAGAAEAVVEIEVAKRGVDIVEKHQAHHAAAEPDAFGVAGRPVDGLGGFGEFIDLALIFLGGVRRLRAIGGRLALVLRLGIAALGEGASNTDQQDKPGDGEVAQNLVLKLKHTATHEFPDCRSRPRPPEGRTGLIAVQMGPQYGGDFQRNPMTDISIFVQQTHNFIAMW